MKKFILIILIVLSAISLSARTFEVNRLNSILYISALTALDLSNNYFDRQIIEKPTIEELDALSTEDIPLFDRSTMGSYSPEIKKWSDYCAYLTVGSTLYLTSNKKEFWDNLLVFGEIMITQSAVSKWAKTFTRRYRPFVYYEEVSVKKKQERNSQHSFYSMHSSTVFSAATFGYYHYYHNHGHNLPVALLLYGSASATAALRVVSGQHFSSDVITGAVMGSAISYLICNWHNSRKFQINIGLNKINLSYKF